MRKILFIALLLVCITAKKHHKSQEDDDAMGRCMMDHCQEQGGACFMDEGCMKTFERCDHELEKDATEEQALECTKDNDPANALLQCIITNCPPPSALQSILSRRRH